MGWRAHWHLFQSECPNLCDRWTQYWTRSPSLLPATSQALRHGPTTAEEASGSIHFPGWPLRHGMLGDQASVPRSMGHNRQSDLVLQSHCTLERNRMQSRDLLCLPALDRRLISETVQI